MKRIKKETILLIDHNDSFTFNIVEVFRSLNQKITVLNYSDLSIESIAKFDKIIFSPGPMLPEDYPKTLEILKQLYNTKQLLGICLGHQIIGEFFNAKLKNLQQVKHGVAQEITLEKSDLFKNIDTSIKVGLYHSWVVATENFPSELKITSRSTDNLIMSLEHREYPVFGIQFHPESFLTKDGKQLLQNFIDL
jgi:anthranilate synthase/aminodeoxychorismate synthase-like glutamine amidotransferase